MYLNVFESIEKVARVSRQSFEFTNDTRPVKNDGNKTRMARKSISVSDLNVS